MALGCSGLQGRRSPMPVDLQFHENAGFCETNWRPLAGETIYPTQSFKAPVEYALPPIIDSEDVALASLRPRRPVNQGAKPLHSRQYSDQADVRTVAGERPVSTQMPHGKLAPQRNHSREDNQRDAEDSPYDYYAP